MGSEWPFIPDHISKDFQEKGLIGQGIIKNEELRGLQTVIQNRIGAATAIYEFFLNTSVRTDAILEEFGLEQPCHYFRNCTNRALCLQVDCSISQKFAFLKRKDIEENLLSSYDDIILKGYSPPTSRELPSLKTIKSRPYISYDCQFLGYRELVFPIFFRSVHNHIGEGVVPPELPDDHVLGVFIVGEICISSRKTIVHKIQDSFFSFLESKRNIEEFGCINCITKQNIKLLKKHDKDLWDEKKEKKKVQNDENYNSFLEKIHEELCQLEENLHNRSHHKGERFALRNIDNVINELNRSISHDISISDEQPLNELCFNISERLTQLCELFSFKYAAIFAIDDPFSSKIDRLPMLAYGNDPKHTMYQRPKDKYFYSTSFLPIDADQKPTSASDQDLRGISPDWPYKSGDLTITILTYPLPFHPNTPIVILCAHRPSMGPTDFDYLKGSLITFDISVVSILSSMYERIAELKTTHSFRVLRHETEPQTQGLKSVASTYLRDVKQLRKLSADKAKDICKDIDDYLDRINYLFGNARNLLTILLEKKNINLYREEFPVVGDVFYKFKDLFRVYLHDRGMAMPLEEAKDNPKWPYINADRRLIDLMLFNILTNAYKYGHRGTNIFLKYSVDKSNYFLSVTNYSAGIEKDIDIFRLFVRSKAVEGEEGAGIGLAIAKAIAKSHEGDINYTQTDISKFNIPFISPFLDYSQRGLTLIDKNKKKCFEEQASIILGKQVSTSSIIAELEKENTEKQKHDNIISGNFNRPNGYIPFINECYDHLLIPTVEVTFTATFPRKEAHNY
jgi:signal transduction histidine kinase